jgi:hypothetical protein
MNRLALFAFLILAALAIGCGGGNSNQSPTPQPDTSGSISCTQTNPDWRCHQSIHIPLDGEEPNINEHIAMTPGGVTVRSVADITPLELAVIDQAVDRSINDTKATWPQTQIFLAAGRSGLSRSLFHGRAFRSFAAVGRRSKFVECSGRPGKPRQLHRQLDRVV